MEMGPEKVIKRATRMAYVAHQVDRFAQDTGKCLDNLYCWAEAADQPPIPIAIFLERLFSFLEQF